MDEEREVVGARRDGLCGGAWGGGAEGVVWVGAVLGRGSDKGHWEGGG